MIRNSIQTRQNVVCKARETFVTIGAMMAVLTLTSGTARAETPVVSPVAVVQKDAVTAQQVYTALNSDPTYYFRHVDVHVQQGVVTLSGYVWSTPAIYRAKEIVSAVPGVARVVDEMELERDGVAPHA
jgi:osmotically-inducible protein OsmY